MILSFMAKTIWELKAEWIPMDKFSAIFVPRMIYNRIQRENIARWWSGVVTQELREIEGIPIGTIPPNKMEYEKVFDSESELVIYSWPLEQKEPFRRTIKIIS